MSKLAEELPVWQLASPRFWAESRPTFMTS
jgi:hypothetical protein